MSNINVHNEYLKRFFADNAVGVNLDEKRRRALSRI
jgi:hypothetical protein